MLSYGTSKEYFLGQVKYRETKGTEYGIIWILHIVVQPIKILVEYVEIIMDIQIPILTIGERDASIMYACCRTRRVIQFTYDVGRVLIRNG
jgi:hypothetical protein